MSLSLNFTKLFFIVTPRCLHTSNFPLYNDERQKEEEKGELKKELMNSSLCLRFCHSAILIEIRLVSSSCLTHVSVVAVDGFLCEMPKTDNV